MNRKYLFYITFAVMILLISNIMPAQTKIYGNTKPVSGNGIFTLKIIKKNDHNCWCNCISNFMEWIKKEFHFRCKNYILPFKDDKDAECALEDLGFTKEKIKWIKKQEEDSRLSCLLGEVFFNSKIMKRILPPFSFGNPFPDYNLYGTINFNCGKPVVINLCNF